VDRAADTPARGVDREGRYLGAELKDDHEMSGSGGRAAVARAPFVKLAKTITRQRAGIEHASPTPASKRSTRRSG
jgi:hypothetical protein